MKPGQYSEAYLKWVKQAGLEPLTNNQHKFAEWLLLPENAKMVNMLGSMSPIFESVRKYLKENHD